MEKRVGGECQSVEPVRLIEVPKLLGDVVQGCRAEPSSTKLQDILTRLLLGTCNHGGGAGGGGSLGMPQLGKGRPELNRQLQNAAKTLAAAPEGAGGGTGV